MGDRPEPKFFQRFLIMSFPHQPSDGIFLLEKIGCFQLSTCCVFKYIHIYISSNTGYYLVIGLTGGSKKLRFTQITQVHALNSFPLPVKQVQVSNYSNLKLLKIFQQSHYV